jgi:hypothetical protein
MFRMIWNKGMLYRHLFETRFQNTPLEGYKEIRRGWNWKTRQLPVSANDANLLGVNLSSTKKYTKALLNANKEVVLEGNTETIK